MSLLGALAVGAPGVQLTVPPRLQVKRDGESAELFDSEEQLVWHLFFFPDLHLELGDREGFDSLLSLHARQIFDDAFRVEHRNQPEAAPRTRDATWTPLVDVEDVQLDGAPALRTVHRMMYEPGREMVMGHLLVPVQKGLFEVRVLGLGLDRTTGLRESTLLLASGKDGFLTQAAYDDPAHDALFPHHPLTQVRAALRGVASWGARVLAPPPRRTREPRTLDWLGCVVRPPPRFCLRPQPADVPSAQFTRVSFCGTDGVEDIFLERVAHGGVGSVVDEALTRSRALHEAAGVQDVKLQVLPLGPIDGRPHVQLIVTGEGHAPVRNVMRWFLDAEGALWSMLFVGGAAVPAELRAADLDQFARSFRLVKKPGLWARLFR